MLQCMLGYKAHYSGTSIQWMNHMPPIDFDDKNTCIFNLQEMDNLLSPDNGQNMCPLRTSSCTKYVYPPRVDKHQTLR